MIKILKRIFYKEECSDKTELIDKIKCIEKRIDINPYSKEYKYINIRSIENNIINYTRELETMLFNLNNETYIIRNINTHVVKRYNFNTWFTDDDFNILTDTNNIWKEFIRVSMELVIWYNKYNSNMNDVRRHGVSIKLLPYITNIREIIDILIKYQNKEIN